MIGCIVVQGGSKFIERVKGTRCATDQSINCRLHEGRGGDACVVVSRCRCGSLRISRENRRRQGREFLPVDPGLCRITSQIRNIGRRCLTVDRVAKFLERIPAGRSSVDQSSDRCGHEGRRRDAGIIVTGRRSRCGRRSGKRRRGERRLERQRIRDGLVKILVVIQGGRQLVQRIECTRRTSDERIDGSLHKGGRGDAGIIVTSRRRGGLWISCERGRSQRGSVFPYIRNGRIHKGGRRDACILIPSIWRGGRRRSRERGRGQRRLVCQRIRDGRMESGVIVQSGGQLVQRIECGWCPIQKSIDRCLHEGRGGDLGVIVPFGGRRRFRGSCERW